MKPLSLISAIVGVLFLILAFIYFTHSADSLPSFLPGHEAGLMKVHYKHGIGALFLGLGAFALAWFKSGKKSN